MTTPTATPAPRKSLKKIKDSTDFYQHQVEGIRQLARWNSFILADDMGLGKSLQALTVAAIDFERGWASRVLVIASSTLKWNWEEEIHEHTNFTCEVLDNKPAKQRIKQLEAFDKDILIVNYEQVSSHLTRLNEMKFDIIIYDESHMIKSPKSKRTKDALKLNGQGRYKTGRHFVLTGSPLLNNPDELWVPLHITDPTTFPKYWPFRQKYCAFGGYGGKQIIGVNEEYKPELVEHLHGRMLRRLKKNVLDLPEKQYIKKYVELHPEQRAMYDEIREEFQLTLPNDPDPMEIENAMTRFLRLKQICATTRTLDPTSDFSSKLDAVEELVTEIVRQNGEKLVIFTQFRAVIEALEERLLVPLGGDVWALHGDVPQQERAPLVRQWGDSPHPGVIIAGLQVAGVGLNMTQANKCIFVDKLFVPKLNEQAEDRLHRIGADKTKPVQIYEMIARRTIESRIEAILRRKEKLFKEIVDTSDLKRKLVAAMAAEDDE